MSRSDRAPAARIAWGAHDAEPASTAPPSALGGRLTRGMAAAQIVDFSAVVSRSPRGWLTVAVAETSGSGTLSIDAQAEVHAPGDDMSGASFGAASNLAATSTVANGLIALAGAVALPAAAAPGDVIRVRLTRGAGTAAGTVHLLGATLE